MDAELLVALMVLWLSTTTSLVFFFRLFLANGGEAFHPHSVDVEHRHHVFLAVNSRTMCKYDCPVKSISTFVAPRGSSSSKQFTVMSCMIAVAGFLGTSRWYALGGVSLQTASLCFAGFAALLLLAAFELDVVPERYLEDKLTVTGWLIEKIEDKYNLKAPFSTSNIFDTRFREFIRSSKSIIHLYEEYTYLMHRPKKATPWIYHAFWSILHMFGACAYVICIPVAILLHDNTESKVSWITGLMFFVFCLESYLSGNFLHVFKPLRGYVLLWNPFVREPHFMIKLKMSLEEYIAQYSQREQDKKRKQLQAERKSFLKKKSSKKSKSSSQLSSATATFLDMQGSSTGSEEEQPVTLTQSTSLSAITEASLSSPTRNSTLLHAAMLTLPTLIDKNDASFRKESARIDRDTLDNFMLRFARKHPKLYVEILGHIAVVTELIAMMTPSVALGLQWVTALCEGPSLYAVIDLLAMVLTCLRSGNCAFTPDQFQHCILRT